MADPSDQLSRNEPTLTSLTLLQRLRQQDQEAWQRMVELYYPLVYRWCRQSGLQQHDVLDVVQEVFRSASTSLDKFRRERPGDTFRGWLRGITRHKLQDHWRHREQAAGGTDALRRLEQVPDRAEGEENEPREAAVVTQRALELIGDEFEERTWQAFWRVNIDGEQPAQVAGDLGMTANAVYKAKARVFRRLREELGDLIEKSVEENPDESE
ncbi:MAG: sigma-70 family RNA polymerase sigma factor [Planctomycetes bacterium]|nr:sigma-70 family RNA polymerase sigma factor [Planctomycetota bacterium]